MAIPSAAIYLREARYFVHSYSVTKDGIAIASEPFLRLESTADDQSLGAAVKSALDAWRAEVASPPASAKLIAPLLRLAGVKSWRAFMRGAKYLSVARDGERTSLEVLKSIGSRFEPGPGPATVLVDPSNLALGARIREMLRQA